MSDQGCGAEAQHRTRLSVFLLAATTTAVACAPRPGPEHARDRPSGARVQLEGIPLCIVSKCMHMYIYVCVGTCIYAYIHIYTKVYQAKAVT